MKDAREREAITFMFSISRLSNQLMQLITLKLMPVYSQRWSSLQ